MMAFTLKVCDFSGSVFFFFKWFLTSLFWNAHGIKASLKHPIITGEFYFDRIDSSSGSPGFLIWKPNYC